MLTHYRGGEPHETHHRAAASKTFGQAVELAREGQTYTIG
jgi:hypothetical protein